MLDPISPIKDPESELFNYTTGKFLANNDLRLRERRRIFDIPGLFRIVAKALNCKPEEIVAFRKLEEGGFNRSFLITSATGFQLVARIPYPIMFPKGYALASEVATMDFLRSKGIPIPKVYAYSFTSENEARTEYVLMDYVGGTDLSQIWIDLEKDQISSLMIQFAKLESTMMSISFPAGGSIYYAEDLQKLCGNEGILLEDDSDGSLDRKCFCIGPDVSPLLWYGRREQLDVFRGPYKDVESVLVAGAKKELKYLERFGSPRVPYLHHRREYYNYKKQPPLDHIKNLCRYLDLAPSLVPDDDSLHAFCIRHPDLTDSHIKVTLDSSGLQILSVLDWQHAAVLPLFLQAGMPYSIQNEEDEVSRSMVEPELLHYFAQRSEENQVSQKELLRRRLVHYQYKVSTAVFNRIHHKALVYPLNGFCRRIFHHANSMWVGETVSLLYALMDMVNAWANFAKDGEWCPVAISEDEQAAAEELYKALLDAESSERMLNDYVGCGDGTWVPAADYEDSKARARDVKQRALEVLAEDKTTTEEERAAVDANWPLDDMDEDELDEYK